MKRYGIALATGLLVAAAGVGGAGGGCTSDSNYHEGDPAGQAGIDIKASTTEALVGDTVTFVASSSDTYGRDANIKWSSTAGDIDTEQDGRVARVTFKESGTYSIKATLEIDGRVVETDMVEIRVKPVR